MAVLNDAVLKVGTGHFYTAPVGTALPADLRDVTAGGTVTDWVEMGHTSLDDILSAASEGGDVTTLGSLQNPTLRQATAARTESYTMNLLQFDADSLKLYYGANAVVDAQGNVQVPQAPVPSELAWLFVFEDGDVTGGLYAPRTNIFRAEDMTISDTESLSSLPLQVTPLAYQTNSWAYTFIPPKAAV